jgi:hypothetical protein
MKILPESKFSSPIEAIDLTPNCECAILKISELTYAFCARSRRHPYLIIESEIFGLLMYRLKDRIANYKVFRDKCMCCDDDGEIIIRITEIDGFVYQIDENDNIEICMDMEKVYNDDYEKN